MPEIGLNTKFHSYELYPAVPLQIDVNVCVLATAISSQRLKQVKNKNENNNKQQQSRWTAVNEYEPKTNDVMA